MSPARLDRTLTRKARGGSRQVPDNDDMRGCVEDRSETKPDTKGEARAMRVKQWANNARGTDANPTGAEGNDGQKRRPRHDERSFLISS